MLGTNYLKYVGAMAAACGVSEALAEPPVDVSIEGIKTNNRN